MKKIYLLCVAVIVAACSAEPVETEGLESLDAAVAGKGKVATQEIAESFNYPEILCVGDEGTFTFNFPDSTNPGGQDPGTQLQLQLLVTEDNPETDVDETVWENIFGPEKFYGGGSKDFFYSFEKAGTYELQYKIGNGGFTNFTVSVLTCEYECPSGYMVGNLPLSEIPTSNNWGWAHQFNLENNGSETRKIQQKETILGEVTVSYENKIVVVTPGAGVNITHMYVSNEIPTTNAPGQFNETQVFEQEDGNFWVIVKADVCP